MTGAQSTAGLEQVATRRWTPTLARWTVFLLALTASLTFAVSAASAASDITGTWTCCGTTSAGTTQAGAQSWVITESGSGAVTGTGLAPGGSVFATITGSVSGTSVTIVTTYTVDLGYVATFTGTASANGSTISGSWISNQHQMGTFTATRTSGPGEPSATAAICNLDLTTDIDTCGATVADANQPPVGTPTGQVAFTNATAGAFLGTGVCSLAQTPFSPGVASCTVQFRPADVTVFPSITASYQGDNTFMPSSGGTSFLSAGNVTGLENDNGPMSDSTSPDPQQCQAPPDEEVSSSNTGDKIATKLCQLLAMGPLGYIAYASCAGAGPFVETGIVPAVCVIALVALGLDISWLRDPPDKNYLSLAIPRATSVSSTQVKIRCGRLSKHGCALLAAAYAAYLRAFAATNTATAGLSTTGDRLGSARKAGDVEAILFQIAARKIYMGEIAAAQAVLNKRSAALAKLLKLEHLNAPVPLESPSALVAKLGHSDPAVLKAAVIASGHPLSVFTSELAQAIRAYRKVYSTPTLASVLAHPIGYGAQLADYRSMSLINVRALVFGLGRGNAISASAAGALLDELSCTVGSTKPDVKAFATTLGKAVPAVYARFLSVAIAPLGSAPACS